MEIKVLSYTQNPEITCAVAMRSTRTLDSAEKIKMKIVKTKSYRNGNTGELYTEENKIDAGCKQSIGCFITDNNLHRFLGSNVACGHTYLTGDSVFTFSGKEHRNSKCEHFNFCATRMLRDAKRMKHWGVFEHVTLTVSVDGISRACTHQLVRHRVASYLQQSQRAVAIGTYEDKTHIKDNEWYIYPETIKKSEFFEKYDQLMERISNLYQEMLSKKIPDEDARFVLPNATKTHIVITMNARSWLHFFKLRLDSKAQWEIRKMAQKILDEFMKISPVIFEGAGELEV